MDAAAAGEGEKKKRRIPPNLRRRAQISCDRCKQRRVRCIRPPNGDEKEACRSCIESGVKCESTLPRKQRIYGSVETLTLRYRVLDALVKGLYPDRDTDNIETLFSIARAHSIVIPDTTGESPLEDVLYQPPSHGDATGRTVSGSVSGPSNKFDVSNPFQSSSYKAPEEKLIPAPHGSSHYIGPSSSFGFVMAVRNMVAERTAAAKSIYPDEERRILQSDFGHLPASKVLESQNREDGSDGVEEVPAVEVEEAPVKQSQKRQKHSHRAKAKHNNEPAVVEVSKKDPISKILPAREVADVLVEAYFDQVHPNYMVFHRGTFQVRYESIWMELNRPLSAFNPGLICCVFMVFVFGAQALEYHDKPKSVQMQRRYLSLVQTRLHQLLHTTSLLNVQALLLLQLHQHNATERNTSWMLLGCASRMAIALGMHREGATGGFDSIEREVRRRVWWTLYIFEQTLCVILGRPSAIDDSEVNVALPNETMLDGGDCVPPGYLDYSVRLTKLTSEIKHKTYPAHNRKSAQDESPNTNTANQLLMELDSWHHRLPPHLRLECLSLVPKQRRAVLLLHIQYRHAQCLVTRPFILRKVGGQLARQLNKTNRPTDLSGDELKLSYACGTYARQAAVLLQQLATSSMFEGVAWLDAYYLYHSVLTLSLDFLARPADETDSLEDSARKTAVRDLFDSVRNTKLCPTFTVLTQVALQLAKIVGIFDETKFESDQAVDARGFQYNPSQQAIFGNPVESEQQVEGVINQWFQRDSVELPWDFFGQDDYNNFDTSFYQNGPPMAGTFTGHPTGFDPSLPTSWVASSNNAYGSWGSVDESYAYSVAGSGDFNSGDMNG